jgi:hypothetical protein
MSNPFLEGTDLYLAYEAGFKAGYEDWDREEKESEARSRRWNEFLAAERDRELAARKPQRS